MSDLINITDKGGGLVVSNREIARNFEAYILPVIERGNEDGKLSIC
ncbi:MAG: hypothetical protein GX996_03615 [Firmicutes bacterium]|nr:hypothetical protein [Bacillota bacterium]